MMQSWQITLKYQDTLYKNIEIMEILSYYQIGGKILYRESDIEELHEKNRQEAFK